MKKKSFVLYADYFPHIQMLSDKEAGKLFKAILEYADTGKIPELGGSVKMCFSFISAQIKRDTEKYDDVCKKRAEAGRKGGLKKAENNGRGSKQYGLGYVRGKQEAEAKIGEAIDELSERVDELEEKTQMANRR